MELPVETFPETRVLFSLLLSVELPLVVLLAANSLLFKIILPLGSPLEAGT